MYSNVAIVETIGKAVEKVKDGWDVWEVHDQVRDMYSWEDVAERTERVYHNVLQRREGSFKDRLCKYHNVGIVAGKIAMMIVIVDYLLMLLLDYLYPRDEIDLCPKFDDALFHDLCRDKLNANKDGNKNDI
jgi:phosphatidylinositol N-acetylglucosaminyltransferase subunit A